MAFANRSNDRVSLVSRFQMILLSRVSRFHYDLWYVIERKYYKRS